MYNLCNNYYLVNIKLFYTGHKVSKNNFKYNSEEFKF